MNIIFALVGPSGAGKSTLMLETVARLEGEVQIIKSLTTRPSRGYEDDPFYEFVDADELRRRNELGWLIAIVEYAGSLYANDIVHIDTILQRTHGICALTEEGVLNHRNRNYPVVALRVTPEGQGFVARNQTRSKADRARPTNIPGGGCVLEIRNSFMRDGKQHAVDQLVNIIQSFTLPAASIGNE